MIAVLATSLVMVAWLGLRAAITTDAVRVTIASVAVSIPPAIAAWIAWKLRDRADIGARIASGWQMIGVACIAAVGSSVTAIAPVAFGARAGLWTAMSAIFHYLMVAFILAGLTYWVRRFTPEATLGAILDLAAVGLLGYLTVWNTTLQTAMLGGGTSTSRLDELNMFTYPVSDVLLLVAAIAVLSQIGRYELRGAEIMATFGVVGMLVADLRFAFEGSGTGDVISAFVRIVTAPEASLAADTFWYAGFLCIGVGAAVRSRPNSEQEYQIPLVERSTTWEMVWTIVPFAMLAAAMVAWQRVADQGGITNTVFLALVGILITRGVIIALTNLRRARTGDTDPLTGAFNHSYLQDIMPSLVQRALQDGQHLSLVTIDIDDFASHNEAYGFHEGDRLLREMAYVIRTTMDHRFMLFRPGGDEFAVAMPRTTTEEALEAARQLERIAGSMKIAGLPGPTLTMGIAGVPAHTSDPYELIQLSSGSLYFGKMSGKHSITVYDPDAVTVMSTEERMQRIEQNARLRTVLGLARALDTRDPYTARHSHHVAAYAVAIAAELGWDSEQQELLRIAGLLHDVGKIGVRDATLLKTSALSSEERMEMRRHPEMSAQVIAGVAPNEILPWVIGHHERWDGTGYPHGMSGQEIPLGARILAVADTFDAMTSSRSYRQALPVPWAVTEIGRCAHEQFDPEVVRAFLRAVSSGAIIVDTEADAHAAEAEAQRAISYVDADVQGTVQMEPEFTPLAVEWTPGDTQQRAA